MKKIMNNEHASNDDTSIRNEYDFLGGIRGKHYHQMSNGYKIIVHHPDGTSTIQEITPEKGAVILAPDVQKYFPDSESVNATLRTLIKLVPFKRKPAIKELKEKRHNQLPESPRRRNRGIPDHPYPDPPPSKWEGMRRFAPPVGI
jgi:hypothetical protein